MSATDPDPEPRGRNPDTGVRPGPVVQNAAFRKLRKPCVWWGAAKT